MQILVTVITDSFWVLCYVAAIWICVIGRKQNPHKGWNFIITGAALYLVAYLPAFYYRLVVYKFPITFLNDVYHYVRLISWILLLPGGMILFLLGLYYMAQGTKKKPKKTVKKRSGTLQ